VNVIDRIQARLEEDGWHQGSSKDYDTGAVCLARALSDETGMARRNNYKWAEGYGALILTIRELFPERGNCGIVGFNDHPDTTIEDVQAVLERARVRAESPGDYARRYVPQHDPGYCELPPLEKYAVGKAA
jgi:hypothetical protein